MNRRVLLIVVAGLAASWVLAAGCASPTGASPGGQSIIVPNGQQSGIWVSGEGKVTAAPDVAILSLGIEAQAKTVSDAQNSARTAMAAVVTALKANGVKEKDIQTQRFSIFPVVRYIEKENTQEIIGYRVTNVVTAKVRQLDEAGRVIDAVAEAGGDLTRVENIGFTVDDPKALQAEAQQAALKDAKEKAKAAAETLGVRLGKLTYAQTSNGGVPFVARAALEKAAGSAPDTVISPGEIQVTASVQAAWAID